MLSTCCRSPVKNVYARWAWGKKEAVERKYRCLYCHQPCDVLTPEQMNDVALCTHGLSLVTRDCDRCRQQTGGSARILRTNDTALRNA
jgi:hypothetical protein